MRSNIEIFGDTHLIVQVTPRSDRAVFEQIADIHLSEIAAGFLSSLGREFLMIFYRATANANSAIFLADIEPSGQHTSVRGFIVGSISTNRLQREILWSHGAKLLICALRNGLISKRNIRGIIDIMRYPSKGADQQLPASEIVNFCVRREIQGQGLGTSLFQALVKQMVNRRVPKLKIVTGQEQASAQRFYSSLGATRIGDISIHNAARSLVYIYDLPNAALN